MGVISVFIISYIIYIFKTLPVPTGEKKTAWHIELITYSMFIHDKFFKVKDTWLWFLCLTRSGSPIWTQWLWSLVGLTCGWPFSQSKTYCCRFLGSLHRIKLVVLNCLLDNFMIDYDCTVRANLTIICASVKSTRPVLLYYWVHLCKSGHSANKSLKGALQKQITRSAPISSRNCFSIKANPLRLAPSHPKAPSWVDSGLDLSF